MILVLNHLLKIIKKEGKINFIGKFDWYGWICIKSNSSEFKSNVIKQISGRVIRTKFAPPDNCVVMNKVENKFIQPKEHKPWVWFRLIGDMFFI